MELGKRGHRTAIHSGGLYLIWVAPTGDATGCQKSLKYRKAVREPPLVQDQRPWIYVESQVDRGWWSMIAGEQKYIEKAFVELNDRMEFSGRNLKRTSVRI